MPRSVRCQLTNLKQNINTLKTLLQLKAHGFITRADQKQIPSIQHIYSVPLTSPFLNVRYDLRVQ